MRIAKLAVVFCKLQQHGVQLYIVSLGVAQKIDEWLAVVGLRRFFERIYGSAHVGSEPKFRLIQERIMVPSALAREHVLFVDDDFGQHLAAATLFCRTYHAEGPMGLSDADLIRICDDVGVKDAMLHVAGEHVKPYFLKPY